MAHSLICCANIFILIQRESVINRSINRFSPRPGRWVWTPSRPRSRRWTAGRTCPWGAPAGTATTEWALSPGNPRAGWRGSLAVLPSSVKCEYQWRGWLREVSIGSVGPRGFTIWKLSICKSSQFDTKGVSPLTISIELLPVSGPGWVDLIL